MLPRPTEDRWTGKSGEKPARTRHCDRASTPSHVTRQPLAPRPGRRDGQLVSQETSLRSVNVYRPRGKGPRHETRTCSRRSASPSRSSSPSPRLARRADHDVNVRIEGATKRSSRGRSRSNPTASSPAPTPTRARPCDGINALDPENVAPAPTPTAASADAMALIGETFDGKWYDGFDDYFITRFGPDAEVGAKSWGILVNDTFTSVGGCQYQLDEGDEVLWIYNAFTGRPSLALFPEANYRGRAAADRDGDAEPALRGRSRRLRRQPGRHPLRTSGTGRLEPLPGRRRLAGDDERAGLRARRHRRSRDRRHRRRRQGADHLHDAGLAPDQGDGPRHRRRCDPLQPPRRLRPRPSASDCSGPPA